MKRIKGSLGKVISKNVTKGIYKDETEGKAAFDEIMSRVSTTTNIADAHDCDLIIEAIAENMELKLNFYKTLGPLIKPSCIFASNTSSLQITAMSEASGRPNNFVGLHFFNPVQIMKLVEVINTKHTDTDVFDAVAAFGKKINKTTVKARDTPGFIVNRLLIPYLSESMAMVDREDATVGDIDVSMQLGAGHPMGPLHLADYVGLDIIHSSLKGWKADFPNDPTFFIPKCLEKLVSEGNLGRKTGQGFYNWTGDKREGPVV
jgi:3-hydroxyacyl-CoA dehydrogenase